MIVDPASAPVSGENGCATLHLSAAGALTQFGAYIDTLQPGAFSSHRHWHEAEDEFLYVLEGTATLIDDDGPHDLAPGDAVAWPHGDPNAHHMTNRSDRPCRYLIVGTRVAGDICHYPDSGTRQINRATTWAVEDEAGTVLRGGDLPPELLGLPPRWGSAFDPSQPKTRILRRGAIPANQVASSYPAPFRNLGHSDSIALSDAGGLSQFGVFIEILHPGASSSQRHWHETEDEFVYVLDGTATLIENHGPRPIGPGTCVCWPRAVPNGHCLRNDTDTPATLFILGARLANDACHYPDIDLHYSRRNGTRSYAHKNGAPYPGWPKETKS